MVEGAVRIDIRGAAEVAAALGRVERRLRSDFLNALKKTLDPVVPVVQSNIRSQGLVESGTELGSVRPFYRAGGAEMGIVVGATNKGFNYPAKYEGERPVLDPAWDRMRPEIVRSVERFLDDIISDAGLGGKSGL
jgi:hypothetical protein